MYILGIDTSAVTATAAVCREEDGVIKEHALFSLKNGLTHSENLLPLIDGVMRAMGVTAAELGLIAVTAGPGSFTGVRIGVATAKGLAFAHGIPCAGVSAPEIIARNCAGYGGIVCPVMDARRNQFYNALFENGKRLCEDRCVSFGEIFAEIKDRGAMLCGDGARLFYSLCGGKGNVKMPSLCTEDQNALSVCEVGYEKFLRGETVTHSALRPVYLRVSQAERERNERTENDERNGKK